MSDEQDRDDDKLAALLDEELDDDTGSDVSLADDLDNEDDEDSSLSFYDEGLDESNGFSY